MLFRTMLGIVLAALVGIEPAHAAIHVPMQVFVVILGGVIALALALWGIVGLIYLVQRFFPSERVQVNAGVAEMKKGRYDAALKHFDKAVALAPTRANPLHWRAQAYQAKGDRERARADYRTALALDPEPARRVVIEQAIRSLG